MAPSPTTNKKRGLAAWYRRFGEDLARERGLYKSGVPLAIRNRFITEKTATKVATLKQTVRDLRSTFKGFESASGYNLNDVRFWTAHQVKQVEKYGEYLHHLQSQPHEIIRPRNKKQKISLQTFTSQYEPKQKAYVVHKSHPNEQIKVTRTGEIIITRKVSDKVGTLRSDFYFFNTLLGYQPIDWDEVYAATAEILPYMPDGNYFIYSSLHGEIDAPHPKRSLLSVIARYGAEYKQKDFASTIKGFKRIADNISPDEEYSKIYYRRKSAAAKRKADFDALVKRVTRRQKKKKKRKHK